MTPIYINTDYLINLLAFLLFLGGLMMFWAFLDKLKERRRRK